MPLYALARVYLGLVLPTYSLSPAGFGLSSAPFSAKICYPLSGLWTVLVSKSITLLMLIVGPGADI